ncbi:hypothetical protein ACOBQJ_01590 [Pelotomaculum propionicicum]|uniref:hypothetical protein n=1 Tax=Pelotomaculum propionicicum TaxID=258475 RepID=UPI003B805D83
MAVVIIFSLAVLLLVVVSLRERMRQRYLREKDWGFIGEAKPSQISQALTNLIGVAGGIYLTLVILATFLELQIPERVSFGRISLEPLAAISILVSLAQPYFFKAVNAWRRL